MAHLSGFGLKNFRVFKEYTWFDFAPITLLVGPNNSGKSSLIKALLLLKDNYERGFFPGRLSSLDFFAPIKYDGGSHNLSSGKNVINEESSRNVMKFYFPVNIEIFKDLLNIEFDFLVSDNFTIQQSYVSINKSTDRSANLFRLDKLGISMNIELIYENLKKLEELSKNAQRKYISKSDSSRIYNILYNFLSENKNLGIITKSLQEIFNEYLDNLDVTSVDIGFNPKEDSAYSINHHEESFDDFFRNITYNGLPELIGLLLDNIEYAGVSDDILLVRSLLSKIFFTDKLEEKLLFLNDIHYLPSVKGYPKRAFQGNDKDVLNKLIKSVHAKAKSNRLQKFLSKWTKEFSLGGDIETQRDDAWDINSVKVGDRNLMDLGYGFTQITILLLMISDIVSDTIQHSNEANGSDTLFYDHRIILVEEPEANLHPKLQSLLADMILEAKETFQIQFIIETHSEYLIRKLQFLTLKNEIKPEDTIIYYFNNPNNLQAEKQVKKITIGQDGRLSEPFGAGFYDESARLMMALVTGDYLN
ncbi:hypothetical protein GCM10027592_09910 [Spirosoma flavus]